MDGLVKMNSSYSSCAVIYIGFNGLVKGCFALCLGNQIVFFAEFFFFCYIEIIIDITSDITITIFTIVLNNWDHRHILTH